VQFLQRGQLLTAQPGAPTNAALGTRVMGLGWAARCMLGEHVASKPGHGPRGGLGKDRFVFIFSFSFCFFFVFLFSAIKFIYVIEPHIK
jgi:hypothetical protein